jgi:hypothetical protein
MARMPWPRALTRYPVVTGGLDRGGGLAQDAADLPGPGLPLRVQFQHARAVADQVSCALLHPGELGVELVPAGVVVADQVAMPAFQHAQPAIAAPEREPSAAYQISRASGVRMVTACGAPGR